MEGNRYSQWICVWKRERAQRRQRWGRGSEKGTCAWKWLALAHSPVVFTVKKGIWSMPFLGLLQFHCEADEPSTSHYMNLCWLVLFFNYKARNDGHLSSTELLINICHLALLGAPMSFYCYDNSTKWIRIIWDIKLLFIYFLIKEQFLV